MPESEGSPEDRAIGTFSSTARWLARQGARHLALIGRRGAEDDATALRDLAAKGGVPIAARTFVTLEAGAARFLAPDLDPVTPGWQSAIEGGRARIALLAPDSQRCARACADGYAAILGAISGLHLPVLATLQVGPVDARHTAFLRTLSQGDHVHLLDAAVVEDQAPVAGGHQEHLRGRVVVEAQAAQLAVDVELDRFVDGELFAGLAAEHPAGGAVDLGLAGFKAPILSGLS